MRIGFVGKGGSGKSALAGTLCRILARRGHRVLALDADNVPGLAFTIGLEPSEEWMLSGAAQRVEGKGWQLIVSPVEAVQRYAAAGPDGIRFLQFGKPAGKATREQMASSGAFLAIVREFPDDGWTVVTDLAAGTRQSFSGWAGLTRTFFVVVEPSATSIMTARRLVRLTEVNPDIRLLGIANKVGTEANRRRVQRELERIGLACWAEVPADPVFAAAEREGRPPMDVDPGAEAIKTLEEIADRLPQAVH